ncbi:MAG: O-antigen ligase family protein [Pseudomonadales bacterium]|nr:O-antigen ligase family protein [Pseudomonadales bacterium]NRA15705.1 O-antigen ligase family protein [Oceanospirillaceae bacterium]
MFLNQSILSIARYYVSFSVFLFLALSVSFDGSYGITGPIIISSYLFLCSGEVRRQIALSAAEKGLIAVLLVFLLSVLLEVICYGVPIRMIDPESKILLFIPLIFLLNAVRISSSVIVLGIGVGALGLFILACYDRYYLGVARVGISISAIQLGYVAFAYAILSLLLAPYCYSINRAKGRLLAILLIVCGALALITVLYTQTRGALIFVPLLLAISGCYYRKQLRKHVKQAVFVACLLSLTGAALIPESSIMSRLSSGVADTEQYFSQGVATGSVGVRLELWKAAVLVTINNPVFGAGVTAYVAEKEALVEAGKLAPSVRRYTHSHNAYVYASARRGMVGLMILLALMFYPVYIGHKQFRQNAQSSRAPAVALIIFGWFFIFANITQVFFAHNSGTIMYTGLLIILVSLMLNSEKELAGQP